MHRWRWAAGLIAPGLLLLAAGIARAERVPSEKTVIPPSTGTRIDITVPYTTNGYSTLGVYNGVAPKIYASPIVDYPSQPQAKPVYNLPFYGAVQAFGDRSEGATPRPPRGPLPR